MKLYALCTKKDYIDQDPPCFEVKFSIQCGDIYRRLPPRGSMDLTLSKEQASKIEVGKVYEVDFTNPTDHQEFIETMREPDPLLERDQEQEE